MKCPLCREQRKMVITLEAVDRATKICPACGVKVIDCVAESAAIKITEIRLRHYPEHKIRLEMIPPESSQDILLQSGRSEGPKTSVQEKWVIDNEREMRTVAVIDKVLAGLDESEKELIRQAYFMNRSWEHVIQELHLSRSTFYRQKNRLVRRFARAFGLL